MFDDSKVYLLQPQTLMARGPLWQRVELARELAAHHTPTAVRTLVRAARKGDVKAAMWILQHATATDEQGNEVRPVAPTVDLPKLQVAGGDTSNAPRILIGVALGNDFAQLASGQTAIPTLPAPAPESQPVSLPAIDAQIIKE